MTPKAFHALFGRRVALRISRIVFSALSGMRLLACLIVAPQRGYDEPAILTQSAHSVRQVPTAYKIAAIDRLFAFMSLAIRAGPPVCTILLHKCRPFNQLR